MLIDQYWKIDISYQEIKGLFPEIRDRLFFEKAIDRNLAIWENYDHLLIKNHTITAYIEKDNNLKLMQFFLNFSKFVFTVNLSLEIFNNSKDMGIGESPKPTPIIHTANFETLYDDEFSRTLYEAIRGWNYPFMRVLLNGHYFSIRGMSKTAKDNFLGNLRAIFIHYPNSPKPVREWDYKEHLKLFKDYKEHLKLFNLPEWFRYYYWGKGKCYSQHVKNMNRLAELDLDEHWDNYPHIRKNNRLAKQYRLFPKVRHTQKSWKRKTKLSHQFKIKSEP